MSEYRSNEELYFSWWLNDLIEQGVVRQYMYESNTFTLAPQKWYNHRKIMVTKVKINQLSFLEPHVYTPDFIVEWNPEWDGIFFRDIDSDQYSSKPPFFCIRSKKSNNQYSFFEVKPRFDQNNMTRLFRITQKWLYDKHGIFVDLAVVPDIFKKTFTPKRYLLTDKSSTNRKINFETRSVEEYLRWLKSQIK